MNRESLPKLGSKIMLTNPDSVSIWRDAKKGDVGKIVHIYVNQQGYNSFLAYNPNWRCRDDGIESVFKYGGLFICLLESEFEVIK